MSVQISQASMKILFIILVSHIIRFLIVQKWCHLHYMSWRDDNCQEIAVWAPFPCTLSSIMVREATYLSYLQSLSSATWKWNHCQWASWTSVRCSSTWYIWVLPRNHGCLIFMISVKCIWMQAFLFVSRNKSIFILV